VRALSFRAIFVAAMIFISRPMFPQAEFGIQKGFTEYETFQGTLNSDSRLFKIDSTVGWDFNKHFGIYGGVPFYFANIPGASATATAAATSSTNTHGIGNAYVGMAFRAPNSALDYVGAITASAPTGSTSAGLSTGRAGVDFTNHFSHSFSRFTPFVEAGVSNTVPDSSFFTRPFTSLGAITHFEEGADYEIVKRTYIGASAYEIVPFGNQKIFSKLVGKGGNGGGGGGGKGNGNNTFDNNALTSGANLTRENGFNGWVAFEPTPLWRVELGFTRSATFDLNSFAFNLRFNVGKMLRSRKTS
jgi:hypothetical protein